MTATPNSASSALVVVADRPRFSAALAIIGLAVGTWLMPIGIAVFVVAIVGWVYEYYRGNCTSPAVR